MPLSNKEELNLIVNPDTKLNIEHSGGDGWTILHGDMLSIVKAFKPGVLDAVITDPPYASGGSKPSEKNRTTAQKYSSMKADKALPDFDGDQKDQRSWTRWCAEWLSDVRRACKPGAVLVVFIDWRMAPCLSDAIQWAGWIWRGQIVWDKQVSRPQRGRQQSEYALWASNGPLPMDRPVGCLPGVFRYDNYTGRSFLTYLCALKEIKSAEVAIQVAEVAARVHLENQLDKRLSAYSGGMKQRLLLAGALLGNPHLLILDEPTAGLDPKERVRLRELLTLLANKKVILVATHVVSDVESVAREILLLKDGRLVAQDSVERLIEQYTPGGGLESVYLKVFGEEGKE